MPVKSFVLVLSLSLIVYHSAILASVPRETQKRSRQYEAETLPEAEKNQAGRKRSRIILFANRAVTGRI